eukprot:scpid100467/ scgid18648/ 
MALACWINAGRLVQSFRLRGGVSDQCFVWTLSARRAQPVRSLATLASDTAAPPTGSSAQDVIDSQPTSAPQDDSSAQTPPSDGLTRRKKKGGVKKVSADQGRITAVHVPTEKADAPTPAASEDHQNVSSMAQPSAPLRSEELQVTAPPVALHAVKLSAPLSWHSSTLDDLLPQYSKQQQQHQPQ